MPYAPHLRLSVRGVFSGPSGPIEQWQWGLNLAAANNANSGVVQAALDSAVEAVDDLWKSPGALMQQKCPVTEIKIASIGADGRYVGGPLVAGVNIPGYHPGNSLVPPQVALVVSLQTARRGATGRGRVYLPAPVSALAADWRIPVDDAQGCATAFAAFLRDLATSSDDDLIPGLNTPCVASTKGYNTPVDSVRVGRVLDTIRTRRGALVEAYGANVESAIAVVLPD